MSIIAEDLIRIRYTTELRSDNQITINKRSFINFSSNDYLNLACNDDVLNSYCNAVTKYGLGSGSSALVSGYYTAHDRLEKQIAEFFEYDNALLFNSGYLANIGTISTLANKNSLIVADKLCHASIIDGIKLSNAKYYRYQHHNLSHLETLIQKNNSEKFIITEGVFSMQGDMTPLNKVVAIASQSHANLIVDDAHGVGVLGKNGKGVIEHFALTQNDIACLILPLGKAFASLGALVCCNKFIYEKLIQLCKTYRYTTALPPAIAAATLTVLQKIKHESWRREKLSELILFFIQETQKRGLNLISNTMTPIKSILIGNNHKALTYKQILMEKGFFVSCIRPPTVPNNTARLRISLTCAHTKKNIIDLLDLLAVLICNQPTSSSRGPEPVEGTAGSRFVSGWRD